MIKLLCYEKRNNINFTDLSYCLLDKLFKKNSSINLAFFTPLWLIKKWI
jgi:hypothetical protein